MATLIIDTHNFITRLKASGMDEKQAVAIADGLKEVNLEGIATKEDIVMLKEDLLKLESRLYKWGFAALLAQGALIVALIELLGS